MKVKDGEYERLDTQIGDNAINTRTLPAPLFEPRCHSQGRKIIVEELPPVTPTPCEDAVSRQAAIDALKIRLKTTDVPVSYPGIIRALEEWLRELPSAQPDIIHCRDCKFYTPLNRETKSGICSLLIHQNFGDDWYCAGAERRTDE